MNLHWIRTFRKLSRKLSVRAGLFCIGAIIATLLAVMFSPYVSDDVASLLGGDAVDRILTILASSMLVVVTFSLSTLIASYSVAGASAPPRATTLIMRDSRAQTALATFLGAFIFSIVSLVALSTGYYGPKGRVILFAMTIAVLTTVIWTVIRWIGQLSEMGQLAFVIKRIERASILSVEAQAYLFFTEKYAPSIPSDAITIASESTGFLQTIDLHKLSELVKHFGGEVWIECHAGQFIFPHLPLAQVGGLNAEAKAQIDAIRKCFFVGDQRTFEDDPRFGLIVLSEIASRALSPGINDPGSAIEIIGSLIRVIAKIENVMSAPEESTCPKEIHLRPVTTREVLDDAFHAIARDGGGNVEVGIFLQKALSAISHFPNFSTSAYDLSLSSLKRNKNKMDSPEDIERIVRATDWHKLRKNSNPNL